MRARNIRFRAPAMRSARRRVDATPAAVAPGQIPARPRRSRCRNVVYARRAPGLAAQQPRQRHPSAAPKTKAFDRFVGIGRAGRQMPAVVADQRRQRVPIEPDHAAPGIARQAQERACAIRAKVCSLHRRSAAILTVILRGVPMHGTLILQVFTPQLQNIAHSSRHCSKGPMDDSGQHGYRFDNAAMTESCRVWGPSQPQCWGLGKDPN
jgi:hypothetical protein